ncbi:MAG: hypothetical protein AAGI28_14135 [Pseudomonadota bacterium]
MTEPSDPDNAASDVQGDSIQTSRKLPLAPSTGAAVNLAIAEIVLRGIADRMRGRVEKDISQADAVKHKTGEKDAVDGRSLLTSIGLYGAAKLAKRSRSGLGLVAGGLIAKSLYDRGKAVRERRLRPKDKAP